MSKFSTSDVIYINGKKYGECPEFSDAFDWSITQPIKSELYYVIVVVHSDWSV